MSAQKPQSAKVNIHTLRKMKETVAKVERNPRHPWHDLLGDLTNRAFEPAY